MSSEPASPSETWYWQRTWDYFRHGDARVRLIWPGGEGVLRLYDAGVPDTVAAFLDRLPLDLPVVHVAWSGDMVMGAEAVPLAIAAEENRVRLVRPGDLAYDPKHGEVTLTYGTAEARLPSGPNTLTVIGTLCQGLPAFALWARARRFEGVGTLRFERLTTEAAGQEERGA